MCRLGSSPPWLDAETDKIDKTRLVERLNSNPNLSFRVQVEFSHELTGSCRPYVRNQRPELLRNTLRITSWDSSSNQLWGYSGC